MTGGRQVCPWRMFSAVLTGRAGKMMLRERSGPSIRIEARSHRDWLYGGSLLLKKGML